MIERRQYPRTPGTSNHTLDDVTHRILRKHKNSKKTFDPDVLILTYDDLVFLHAVGAEDWRYAGLLCFQRVIDQYGSRAEKERLAAMGVGYSLGDANGLILSEFDRQFLQTQGIGEGKSEA